jgi:hypothetical protein
VGKKYPLITYEKALLNQATGGKFPSVTFIERKQMSTKTSIKRIALVAAAALTLGGFTAVSAHAGIIDSGTTPAWAATSGTVYSGAGKASATQTVGSTATVVFSETVTSSAATDIFANFSVGGVGSVTTYPTAVSGTTAITVGVAGSTIVPAGSSVSTPYGSTTTGYDVFNYGPVSSAALTLAGALVKTTFVLYSAVAGTQTVTAIAANGTAYTATITWVASSAVGVTAANSYAYTASSTAGCQTSFATQGLAAADQVANGSTSQYYGLNTATSRVCVAAFDGSGNPITPSSVKVFGIGSANGGVNQVAGNVYSTLITSDGTNKGASTYTVYVTDAYGTTVTLTTPAFTFYGKLAKVVLANNVYADHASASSSGANYKVVAGLAGLTDTTGLHSFAVQLQDSAGNTIPRSAWSTVTNDIGTSTLGVVSDKGNGNTSTGAKGQTNSYATITYDAAGYDGAGQGKSWGGFNIACSQSAKYEHLKITAYGYNSATSADDIASNSVDFYCSGLASKVVVTPAATTADAGTAVSVNATVTDAAGYPVADGTAIAFGASNGGTFLGGDLATTGGTQYNASNLIVGSQGDNVITALVQGATPITATATIAVNGGVSGTSSLALDAANAATDAANNAYDEAQNATQAASDALAAVTALSAQVSALIATVKSLAAMVAKIKAKVKA